MRHHRVVGVVRLVPIPPTAPVACTASSSAKRCRRARVAGLMMSVTTFHVGKCQQLCSRVNSSRYSIVTPSCAEWAAAAAEPGSLEPKAARSSARITSLHSSSLRPGSPAAATLPTLARLDEEEERALVEALALVFGREVCVGPGC